MHTAYDLHAYLQTLNTERPETREDRYLDVWFEPHDMLGHQEAKDIHPGLYPDS